MAEQREKDYLSTDSDVKRMVDWDNPPTVAKLKKDVSGAMSSHTLQVAKIDKWVRALRGKVNIKTLEGRSKVQPKLIRKQNEWRYAALEEPFLSTSDMFRVNPVTHLDLEAARQNQLILNKQFRVDIQKVPFITKYIRKAVDTGTVIVKVAWDEEFDLVREEVMEPVYPQSPEEFIQFAQGLLQEGEIDEPTIQELLMTGQWQQVQIGEEPVVYEVEKKRFNGPVLEVKDSRSIIVDPSCEGDINKAQFIVDKFLTDMSSLRKDGRYDEEQLKKIQDKEYDNRADADYDIEYDEGSDFRFQDKPRQKLIAYEYWGYWDINNDGLVQPIVATWVGDVMIRLEENPFPDRKFPFVIVPYLPPDTDSIYGDADASLIEDNQNIIGAVTRGIIDLIGRSANAQTGVRKDALDPINSIRFKNGQDFEINPVSDVKNAIINMSMPEVPRSALEVIQLQNNEAESLSGVKAFSQGITGQALGDSVGGIRSSLDATAKREASILRRLAYGLKEIGRKIIAMNSVWLDDEEIIMITDEDYVAIKRDDLAGNFDLEIDIATAESDNQKSQELLFVLQTIGPNVPFDFTKMILVEIAKLKKMPRLAKMLEGYEPQPNPMDVEMQQAQIDLIKAQAGKEASAAPKNRADEVLKYAKAEQAGSSARKTNSDADLVDLSYLEQSTGLSQDRALEQIQVKERAKVLGKQASQSVKQQ